MSGPRIYSSQYHTALYLSVNGRSGAPSMPKCAGFAWAPSGTHAVGIELVFSGKVFPPSLFGLALGDFFADFGTKLML